MKGQGKHYDPVTVVVPKNTVITSGTSGAGYQYYVSITPLHCQNSTPRLTIVTTTTSGLCAAVPAVPVVCPCCGSPVPVPVTVTAVAGITTRLVCVSTPVTTIPLDTAVKAFVSTIVTVCPESPTFVLPVGIGVTTGPGASVVAPLEAVTVTVLVGESGGAAVMVTVLMGMGKRVTLGAGPGTPPAVMVTVEVGERVGLRMPGVGTVMVRVMLRWVWVAVALTGVAVETTVTVTLPAEVVLAAVAVNKAGVVIARGLTVREALVAVLAGDDGVGSVVRLRKDVGNVTDGWCGKPEKVDEAAVDAAVALLVALATGGAVERGAGKLAFDVPVTGGSTNPIHL